jgi:ParB family chromosome partitioning protein
MQAIKEQGLLQPVGVIALEKGGYELAYGNRRFLACSKLGFTKIPCVVMASNGEYSRDLKNLTENVQRKNISLIEAGRFIKLLKKQGLSQEEIAVRLGVTKRYVGSCEMAFEDVPSEHRHDIEATGGNNKVSHGKISLKTAKEIMSQEKTHNLSTSDVNLLFRAAKSGENFNHAAIPKYAKAIKAGHKKDFLTKVKGPTAIRLNFLISGQHADELREKYIENGPFKSLAQLMYAVLKGEKSVHIKMV